ncbi:MAG: cytochrome c oxidase subunit 3 [Planctomycetota bacterium]|nr:cytochrome c oxidase subunit 3 [Planctomycetota bacterium]
MSEATAAVAPAEAAPAAAAHGPAHAPAKDDPWYGGRHPFAIDSKKFGMWLFIASDSITFAAILFAYTYVRLSDPDWPLVFNAGSVALSTLMTFVLLTSSLTMVLGVAAANAGKRKQAALWTFATALGGLAFIVIHAWEWSHVIHGLPEGPLPLMWCAFFTATGMHMLHVTVGFFYLTIVGLAYLGGKFKPIDIEVAGLYWHFVDLVWMFVFPMIYLMSTDMTKGFGH